MISERNAAVLRFVIEDFILTNEPVSSKALLERHQFGVSSATIRNDMAVLEEEGYLQAPHTSSGRVPTDKGYRVFVDQMLNAEAATTELKQNLTELNKLFSKTLDQLTDLDEKLHTSAQLLAKATGEAAVVQFPNLQSTTVRSVEFVKVSDSRALVLLITDGDRIAQQVVKLASDLDSNELAELRNSVNEAATAAAIESLDEKLAALVSKSSPASSANLKQLVDGLLSLIKSNKNDKVAFAGASNLVKAEQNYAGGLSNLLETFEEGSDIWKALNTWRIDGETPKAIIGSENSVFEFSTSSLLLSGYSNQGSDLAKVAVLGPTRMNYARNLAAVLALSQLLSKNQED
jgi:heat-inducible transcriptional repressor